jgi:hypothetical protein
MDRGAATREGQLGFGGIDRYACPYAPREKAGGILGGNNVPGAGLAFQLLARRSLCARPSQSYSWLMTTP